MSKMFSYVFLEDLLITACFFMFVQETYRMVGFITES